MKQYPNYFFNDTFALFHCIRPHVYCHAVLLLFFSILENSLDLCPRTSLLFFTYVIMKFDLILLDCFKGGKWQDAHIPVALKFEKGQTICYILEHIDKIIA